MGKSLLYRLTNTPNTVVHAISRGNPYWNEEYKSIPNLRHHKGDRDNFQEFSKLLKWITMNLPTEDKTWHMVVDFCVFLRKDIKLVYRSLKHQIGLYVYISSDSVYEACDERVRPWYVERQKCSNCNPPELEEKKELQIAERIVLMFGKDGNKKLKPRESGWDWGNNINQYQKNKKKTGDELKGRVFKQKKRGKNADTDAFDTQAIEQEVAGSQAVVQENKQPLKIDDMVDPTNWGLVPEEIRSDIDPDEKPLFNPECFHHIPLVEEDAVRPPTDGEVFLKAELDAYGHNKLRSEEYLRSHCLDHHKGFPFICLRLPDVIGPYDGSVRYWAYMKWFKYMEWWPIHFESVHKVRPLGLVASEDVAGLITGFVDKIEVFKHDLPQFGKNKKQEGKQDEIIYQKLNMNRTKMAEYGGDFLETVHGESYNLSFDETPTYIEFINMIVRITNRVYFNIFRVKQMELIKLTGLMLMSYHLPQCSIFQVSTVVQQILPKLRQTLVGNLLNQSLT